MPRSRPRQHDGRSQAVPWGRLLAATMVIHAVLAQPWDPARPLWAMLAVAPELPVLILSLACLPMIARPVVALCLCLLALQKGADLATVHVLGRPFTIVSDLPLVGAAFDLLAGVLGTPATVAIAAAIVALVGAGAAGIWWACGQWTRVRPRQRAIAPAMALAGLSVLAPGNETLQPANSAYVVQRVSQARQTLVDLHRLRTAVAEDPFRGRRGLLGAIDRDVLVIFVESYGRASFDAPFYADRHGATLRRAEAALEAAGLSFRSGFVKAPTRGGQSWLSHATLASGLRIDDQTRYRALLASGYDGLFHHARRAGFRTAAVMPAITRPWPEAAAMGFDTILAASDLGYRGKPFNWITMPDQFTLAATDQLLRRGQPRPAVFAQVALISSHAPWVPVPRLLDWDQLGDGSVFDEMAAAGDPPDVVWRDPERVRRAYRDALDYSLATVMDYALRHAADPPLLIVLGDHQAAPWVALDSGADTPLHLIGPDHLVRRAEAWGLSPGLVPAGNTALAMESLRNLILDTFSRAVPPGGISPGPACRAASPDPRPGC
ncbi:sulfatase [Paracoccus fontiphilus]|uniref:Sulfatase n=1 Tax=Paracoccus fontiphilus TaxID=1815556 RepID=A0ABV7IGA6_9RHOB|nr:sulfatase [Paracoccus fontiphilus]